LTKASSVLSPELPWRDTKARNKIGIDNLCIIGIMHPYES
jgi:hypothetical protein